MDIQIIVSDILNVTLKILIIKMICVLVLILAVFVIIRIWWRYRHYKKRDLSSPPESHTLQSIISIIGVIVHQIMLHPNKVKSNPSNIPMVDTPNIDETTLLRFYEPIHTSMTFVFIYFLIMTHIDIAIKYWIEFKPWIKSIFDWFYRYPWIKSIFDWFYRHPWVKRVRTIFDWFRRIDNKIDDVIAKEKHVPPR